MVLCANDLTWRTVVLEVPLLWQVIAKECLPPFHLLRNMLVIVTPCVATYRSKLKLMVPVVAWIIVQAVCPLSLRAVYQIACT